MTTSLSWRAALGDKVSRRLWFLDAAKLCAAARRRTGFADFGCPSVEPALSMLTTSLEAEADLHPLGRFLMGMHLRTLLETRLELTRLWRGQSEALALTPIQRPIFITGMPRSGSTFLHELLAEDPANRAPRVWEVMFPFSKPRAVRGGQDPRIKKAAACLWWFRRLAPRADAVFPMRSATPHECVAIHSYTFLSQEFISTCRVSSYDAFLRAADLQPAYAWEKQFLQHLQHGHPAERWVLKSPDHVYGLKELFAVFPDALIIQTHRNPLEVLRSSCQLTDVLQRLYSRPGGREQLVAREARVLAESMDQLIQFRDAHPELADRFVDVKYTELVSNPLAVIQSIYEKLKIPLTNVAAERMHSLVRMRSRYQNHGRAAGDFKLEAAMEAPRFDRYCARFRIALHQPRLG